MQTRELNFTLNVFSNIDELPEQDRVLFEAAISVLPHSYSPYSNYKVAAAVLLANGKVVTGTNQENAAFPVGICAEGTALSACSALHPDVAVKKIAITVKSSSHVIKKPVAPCGICRQRLLEYETRFSSPIEILMTGEEGEVYSVATVKDILPLYFSKEVL